MSARQHANSAADAADIRAGRQGGTQVKFSIAIPTHNRLSLLRDAVETVRRQGYQHWELVIFDNASEEDLAGYVAGLNDQRVVFARSNDFLPVTDSWNRALGMATGDYVTLLGDDDGLMPGYFAALARLVQAFNNPDVIYTNILQFFHPGVAPWEPRGYVADIRNAFFFDQQTEPFLLSDREVMKAVSGSVTLHRNFTFNMQAFCFSRRLLDDLKREGPIFRSPFPDYYLANVAIGRSRATLVVPAPMAIAGVSKASYGFTLFNGQEQKGEAILNSKLEFDPLFDRVDQLVLPGPQYQTNYLLTMVHVAEELRSRYDLRVAFGRYRRLQVLWAIENFGTKKWRRKSKSGKLWSLLSPGERLVSLALSLVVGLSRNRYPGLLAAVRKRIHAYGFIPEVKYLNRGDFSNVLQIFEALQSDRLSASQ